MAKNSNNGFMCVHCPICEGIEHRLKTAKEGGYDPQFEYCGCDKVQQEFYAGGYCADAFIESTPTKTNMPRKTGKAFRRKMRRAKKDRTMRIMTYYGYKPSVGYTNWGWKDGVFQPVGTHVRYPKNSNKQAFWKTLANRRVRRYKGDIPRGNSYRKVSEYAWEID